MMDDKALRERERAHAQRYRNLVTLLVLGSIALTFAFLYAILLPGGEGLVSGVCSIAFVFVLIVAWEFLMKPGYVRALRRREAEDDESDRSPPLR